MGEPDGIPVEVVYALADQCVAAKLTLSAGSTVADAIRLSGLLAVRPEISTKALAAGIYGRRVPLSAVPQSGDRIEIYRPLMADPKQLRLRRVRGASKTAP